jgi:uncharacterized cupin superfamily protein
MSDPVRPPFIVSVAELPETRHSYPDSSEQMSPSRAVGRVAGLRRIGVHLVRVVPGSRTSFPHAEQDEEEFVYVVSGACDVWIDGALHRVRAGDFVAFPAGTGISHTFLNDGTEDAILLSGGESAKPDSAIYYPLNPERRAQLPWSAWWKDVPEIEPGPHDGLPAALRKK